MCFFFWLDHVGPPTKWVAFPFGFLLSHRHVGLPFGEVTPVLGGEEETLTGNTEDIWGGLREPAKMDDRFTGNHQSNHHV